MLKLTELCNDVKKGKVTEREIETLRVNANYKVLQGLYEAANVGKSPLVPQFYEISTAMQVCVEKLKAVKECRIKLVVVMEYCKRISKGM